MVPPPNLHNLHINLKFSIYIFPKQINYKEDWIWHRFIGPFAVRGPPEKLIISSILTSITKEIFYHVKNFPGKGSNLNRYF